MHPALPKRSALPVGVGLTGVGTHPDLWALSQRYTRPASQILEADYYFSAYAHWLPDARLRHQRFVRAQEAVGVTPVMGKFKDKDRWCALCRRASTGHEEKETDVNRD